jgi:predicted DNA-binding transcriptional regulator YafY
MSYKFDALILILNQIDSGHKVTIKSLMDELGVTERTIYRYIETLEQAGFPLYYDKERGRYLFTEGYTLKHPNLSLGETLAFALAKKLIKNFGGGMEESMTKIENKLSLKSGSINGRIFLSPPHTDNVIKDGLTQISAAMMNFQKIKIRYHALYSDAVTERVVDPYYLFLHEGIWHLYGYCHAKKHARTFALDRLISLSTLNEHFIPADISPEENFSGSFGGYIDGDPVEVVLIFDKEIKPYVLRQKWHESQIEENLDDGKVKISFRINGTDGIKPWIYGWIPYVKIVSPKSLVDECEKDINNFIKNKFK